MNEGQNKIENAIKPPEGNNRSDETENIIPPQYEGLSSEIVEDLWSKTIYTDPEKNRIESERRETALELIKKKENDREKQKEAAAGEMYKKLSVENKGEFPKFQQKASSIVAEHIKGTIRLDTKLSKEEVFVLSKLESAWKEEQEENPGKNLTLKLGREVDQKILANLLNKLALELIKIKGGGSEQRQLLSLRDELGISPESKSAKPEAVKTEQSPSQIPTGPEKQAKNWQEVVRVSNVEAVGDLNGSYDSFIDHLKEKNVINIDQDGNIEWIGGNSRVVFVGDILGDRSPEGTKVMREIAKLRESALKAGGNIDVVAGNHEDYFLSFVAGTDIGIHEAGYEGFYGGAYGNYPGVFEFLPYAPVDIKNEAVQIFESGFEQTESELSAGVDKYTKLLTGPKAPTDQKAREAMESVLQKKRDELNKIQALKGNISAENPEALIKSLEFLGHESSTKLAKLMFRARERILEETRRNTEGRKTLESIASLKLVTMQDDTLFMHTNLTPGMTAVLMENPNIGKSIDTINQKYQKGLRHFLMGESLSGEEKKEFYRIKNIFLEELNRENFTEILPDSEKQKLIEEFKKKGINLVLHGHYEEHGKVLGTSRLPIASIDRSAYKSGLNKNPISSLTIEKNGEVKGKALSDSVRQ